MFRNYLKTAWRNIRRHKAYAGINIFGLAVGLGCAMVAVSILVAFPLAYLALQKWLASFACQLPWAHGFMRRHGRISGF